MIYPSAIALVVGALLLRPLAVAAAQDTAAPATQTAVQGYAPAEPPPPRREPAAGRPLPRRPRRPGRRPAPAQPGAPR